MGCVAGALTAMCGNIDMAAKVNPAMMNSRRSSMKIPFSRSRLIGASLIQVSPYAFFPISNAWVIAELPLNGGKDRCHGSVQALLL
jgi:hypothetical protein